MTDKITVNILTKDLMISNYDAIEKLIHLIPGRKWSRDEILADRPMKWEFSLIAQQENEIAGVYISSKKGEYLHNHQIVVDERYRGLGIGKKMILAAAEAASASGLLYLSAKVSTELELSLKFHIHIGFTEYDKEFDEDENVEYWLLRCAPTEILNNSDGE